MDISARIHSLTPGFKEHFWLKCTALVQDRCRHVSSWGSNMVRSAALCAGSSKPPGFSWAKIVGGGPPVKVIFAQGNVSEFCT